jgi:nucleoside phosphorylase
MLERWYELVDSHLQECRVQARPLAGVIAHVRYSHRAPFCQIGKALTQALNRYGAEIKIVDDMSNALANELEQPHLASIDAFIIFGATTGASAEALELAHAQIDVEPSLRDKVHVVMPRAYSDGFIRKRLDHHKISLHLYEESELEHGLVCRRTIDKVLERKRKEEALEKARLSEFKPRIGIITALPIEHDAVISLLGKPRNQRIRKQSGSFEEHTHGTLPAHNGGEHQVVVIRVGVGNNMSAAMTERLFSRFNLDEVFMVGIAGGIPLMKAGDTDVRIGDVVISGRAGLIQYDMVKQRPGHVEPNHPPRAPSEVWLHRARTLKETPTDMDAFNSRLSQLTKSKRIKRPSSATDKLVDDSDPTNPKPISRPRRPAGRPFVHEGPIGSGNKVVKSHPDRETLRDQHKIIAVEMEGSGVADAAAVNTKPFFVIRGICDYANTGKNDVWQAYAAMSAAVFTAMLIESMPLPQPD